MQTVPPQTLAANILVRRINETVRRNRYVYAIAKGRNIRVIRARVRQGTFEVRDLSQGAWVPFSGTCEVHRCCYHVADTSAATIIRAADPESALNPAAFR